MSKRCVHLKIRFGQFTFKCIECFSRSGQMKSLTSVRRSSELKMKNSFSKTVTKQAGSLWHRLEIRYFNLFMIFVSLFLFTCFGVRTFFKTNAASVVSPWHSLHLTFFAQQIHFLLPYFWCWRLLDSALFFACIFCQVFRLIYYIFIYLDRSYFSSRQVLVSFVCSRLS